MGISGPACLFVCMQDHAALPKLLGLMYSSLHSLIVVPLWVLKLLIIRPFEFCLVLTQNTLALPLVSCGNPGHAKLSKAIASSALV